MTDSWNCPSCGTKGNTDTFCPECGAKKPMQKTQESFQQQSVQPTYTSQNGTNNFNSYLKAAAQGDAEAQYLLANCYRYGNGTDADVTQAFAWYQEAAKQGHAKAQNSAGCYCYCIDTKESQKMAFDWFLKAAEQGNAVAQYNLGWICYHYGNGVSQNYKQAKFWLEKSASQNYEYAKTALQESEKEAKIDKISTPISIFSGLLFLIAFIIWFLNFFTDVGISSSLFWKAGLIFGIISEIIFILVPQMLRYILPLNGIIFTLTALIIWIVNFFTNAGISSQIFWILGLIFLIIGIPCLIIALHNEPEVRFND